MEGPFQRGANKTSREKQEANPVWIIRKSPASSEPKYRIPMLRNMDAPWRRPLEESNTKEVNQHDAENDPIQKQEADSSGKETNPESLLELEKFSNSLVSEDPESETSVNPKRGSQESLNPTCDVQEHEGETKFTLTTEDSQAADREGPEEWPENNRYVVQLCVREPSNTQDKPTSKPGSVRKTGNSVGKKKKSKKLSPEAKSK